MYEVRSTMYDLRNSRALRGDAKRERRDVMEPCAEMVRKGRGVPGGDYERFGDFLCLCALFKGVCLGGCRSKLDGVGGAKTAVHEVLLHREKSLAFCRCSVCVPVQVGETVHDVAQEFLRFGDVVLRGVAGGSLVAHDDLAVWKGDDVCGRRVIEKFGMYACDGGIIHQ